MCVYKSTIQLGNYCAHSSAPVVHKNKVMMRTTTTTTTSNAVRV